RLTYAHSYASDNNSLRFTADPGLVISVHGFSDPSIRVFDVTDPKSLREVHARIDKEAQGYAVTLTTLETGGTRTLLALADSQAKQPVRVAPNKPSTWRTSLNSADFVIIGYGEFYSNLQALKSAREKEGIQTQLVDIEDVYDEFSYGNKSPQALKNFLSFARTTWRKGPKYVLLGGTASFDPRNYL